MSPRGAGVLSTGPPAAFNDINNTSMGVCPSGRVPAGRRPLPPCWRGLRVGQSPCDHSASQRDGRPSPPLTGMMSQQPETRCANVEAAANIFRRDEASRRRPPTPPPVVDVTTRRFLRAERFQGQTFSAAGSFSKLREVDWHRGGSHGAAVTQLLAAHQHGPHAGSPPCCPAPGGAEAGTAAKGPTRRARWPTNLLAGLGRLKPRECVGGFMALISREAEERRREVTSCVTSDSQTIKQIHGHINCFRSQ